MQVESFHLAISKRLGWGDMLTQIAIPAINTIIGNYITALSDRSQETYTPEEATMWLLSLKPEDIFGFLGMTDDPNYIGSPEEKRCISLKPFFEFAAKSTQNLEDALQLAKIYRETVEYYAMKSIGIEDVLRYWKVDVLPEWVYTYINAYEEGLQAWCEQAEDAECPGDNL